MHFVDRSTISQLVNNLKAVAFRKQFIKTTKGNCPLADSIIRQECSHENVIKYSLKESASMSVTYKQLGTGCSYTISPMVSGLGEVLTINRSQKREPVRSGLLIQSDTRFELGTLVQLDIKFPGQEHTYRSKGIVSWIEDEPSGDSIVLGITITGMDKLDQYGISVSITEATTPKPPQMPPIQTNDDWGAAAPMMGTSQDDTSTFPQPPPNNTPLQWTEEPLNPTPHGNPTPGDNDDEFDLRESLINNAIQDSFPPPSISSRRDTPLSPEDVIADTIPPTASMVPDFYEDSWDKRNAAAAPPGIDFDIPTVNAIFQTMSLLMPEQAFGERVTFEDVFVLPKEQLPKAQKDLFQSPGKRSDFHIKIKGKDAGNICVVLPPDNENTPPSAYMIEQLLLMYTGTVVQVIRLRDSELVLDEIACAVGLASATVSLRAAMGVNAKLLQQLIKYKDGPMIDDFDDDEDDEQEVIEELAFNDRTSRVSLVVAENNDRHRKTVPIEARVSTVPAKVTGPLSVQIDNLVVEAFESMESLYGTENHDDAAKFSLSLSRRLIKCEAAICALMAPGKVELYIAAIDGAIPETRLGARLSISDGLIGFCMRTSKVARSDNPNEIKESLLRETGLAVKSIMCAPITSNDQSLGTLELINSTSKSGFTREKADLLAYIANSLGEFIANSLPVDGEHQ